MKIAIIGYGKMGKIVERIALERGHKVVCIIDVNEPEKFSSKEFAGADVAIDFSIPTAEPENILKCFAAKVPVVCGTTGWTAKGLPTVEKMCGQGLGTLLWSSNFSIGVNIFRAVNRRLGQIMNSQPQYTPEMLEIHHIHKVDHPSGTAVTISEDMISVSEKLNSWKDVGTPGEVADEDCRALVEEGTLPVKYLREGEVPGVHSVIWESPQDTITLTHSAKGREGFALGAVVAAEWLKGRKGFHTIEEVFAGVI